MNDRTIKNNLNGGFAYLVMIALYLLVSFLGQSILTSAGVTEGRLYYAISATFSSLAIAIVIIYAKKTTKKTLLQVVRIKKAKPVYFALAILLSVGMFMGLGFLNTALASVFSKWGLKITSSNISFDMWYDVVIFGVLVAVFPAILEECFFRGAMLEETKNNSFMAVISVSICFALYHGSIATLFYQFIYGLALTFLAVKAGSILPSVLAHFINNFAVILFTFFNININLFNPIIIAVGCVLLAIFWVFVYVLDKNKNTVSKNSVKEFWLPSGMLGAGLMILLILLNAIA